jgi:hypothetical protein
MQKLRDVLALLQLVGNSKRNNCIFFCSAIVSAIQTADLWSIQGEHSGFAHEYYSAQTQY